MLKCKDETLYTGYATNVERRIQMHENGTGAKYTRGRGPLELVYVEELESKSAALRREIEIKKLPRKSKLALISTYKRKDL